MLWNVIYDTGHLLDGLPFGVGAVYGRGDCGQLLIFGVWGLCPLFRDMELCGGHFGVGENLCLSLLIAGDYDDYFGAGFTGAHDKGHDFWGGLNAIWSDFIGMERAKKASESATETIGKARFRADICETKSWNPEKQRIPAFYY